MVNILTPIKNNPPSFSERDVRSLNLGEAKSFWNPLFSSSTLSTYVSPKNWVESFIKFGELPSKDSRILTRQFFADFLPIFSTTATRGYELHLPLNLYIDDLENVLSSSYLTKELTEEPLEKVDENDKRLNKLRLSLPLKGVLRQKRNGLVYLDISNEFTYGILPQVEGMKRPPFFYRCDAPGSHIPVILPDEWKKIRYISPIKELGQTFHFDLTGFYSTKYHEHSGIETLWLLTIDCPELSELREKYLLSKTPGGHSFYTIVGIKETFDKTESVDEAFFYRINHSLQVM